jgi:ribonuclease HII
MPLLSSYLNNNLLEAGCDEAGRGCYAGPVFAAAVILPSYFKCDKLNDSKQLTAKERVELKEVIEGNALAYAVDYCTVEEIDAYNILKASFMAMHKAIQQLKLPPDFLLIDGNRFISYNNVPHVCIVEGDGLYNAIAAASILAKTARDAYMEKLHEEYPNYDWLHNKGYGTAKHRAAIAKFGLTEHHRKSFNIMPQQTALF